MAGSTPSTIFHEPFRTLVLRGQSIGHAISIRTDSPSGVRHSGVGLAYGTYANGATARHKDSQSGRRYARTTGR